MLKKITQFLKRKGGTPPLKKEPAPALQLTPSSLARDLASLQQQLQLLLRLQYRTLQQNKMKLPSLDEVQFRVFSQTTEDGLLHYVFSLIGTTNKKCIEICAGTGMESNTANLIVNHGWEGLLFDGKPRNVRTGIQFYKEIIRIPRPRPIFRRTWITRDNINDLIQKENFTGEIDLLSLDIDGNDYWVWEALSCVQPRVVILEYASAFGPNRSIAQRYREDYVWRPKQQRISCCGASLGAFVKLGQKKGYRLVGCQNECFNAVFILNGIGEDIFPEISQELCFHHPTTQYNMQRLAKLEAEAPLGEDWVDV